MKRNPDYWDPIYNIYYEHPGCLFPFKVSYYHEDKKDVLDMAGRFENVVKVTEFSMWTGNEKTIWEK